MEDETREDEIIPRKVRRQIKVVFDLPNGNCTVCFPKFVTELRGVAEKFGYLDAVQPLISRLQAFCIAEGVNASWKKFDTAEHVKFNHEKLRKEVGARLADARRKAREAREALGASFPDRVQKVKDIMKEDE